MNVLHADDMATFRREVLESEVPVIVDFWAEWCGPCRMVAPVLDEIANEFGDSLKVVKVDVDRNSAAAHEYGVQSIPMIGLFTGGDMTKAVVGARPRDAIVDALALDRFRSSASPTGPATTIITETMTANVSVDDNGRY